MSHKTPDGFTPQRLHFRSEDAWAVVERPSGAIAMDAEERLLMRMTRNDATDLAAAMTYALEDRREELDKE